MYFPLAILAVSMADSIATAQRLGDPSLLVTQAPMPNLLEGSKPCDYTSLAPTFLPFLGDIQKCTADSNYTFVPPVAYPTAEQIQVLCTTPSCTSTVTSLLSSTLPDCTVAVPNAAPAPLDALIRRIAASCQPPSTTTITPTTTISTTAEVTVTPPMEDAATVVPMATAKSSAWIAVASPIAVVLTTVGMQF
ncbi:hypothetical protein H310_11000 [Aphanomyces invadans]|uniref:Elicitin n=1 Tax=Aphanomyces invadans TaxID=157072 RepID=A0A024TNG5_9STRA|nr:hypothetical protein H310_11000 [Aphanomyces invadans]ETV95558.1 hypothetical protein H310_11000 [Aphanomyces invadans]|eukprot:XP_008875751.1 hypothetical protein H310_11000 [Aphanomyces invadans]